MPKTLAELKRQIQMGTTLEMTRHDWFPSGKLIGLLRPVVHVQTNAIKLDGGSWFYWPKASEVRVTETGFQVCLDQDGKFNHIMEYRIHEAQQAVA